MEYNSVNGDFVHKCVEAIGFGKFHILMLMSLGFRCFVRGSSNSMLAILQPYLRCHFKLSIFTASWLGTTLAIGRLLGAIPIGRMADKFGRRRSMLCLFSLHILLSLLNALSSSYTMILITRASIGLVFEAVMLVYTYGMELLPTKKRNYLAVIDGFYGLGVLFAIFSAMGILETINWRWYVVVNETIPIAICTLLVVFLPESPRYLYSNGYEQEAVKSLEKIAAINGVDLHKVLSEANISLEDESNLFTQSNEKNCEADSLERAQNDSFVTEEAPLQRNRSKPDNETLPSTTKEKGVPHQGGGSWAPLGGRDGSNEHTFLRQSDERRVKGREASLEANAQTTSHTRLTKSELYKRIITLACLRFAVQVVAGMLVFGSMQFENMSSNIACGSCSASRNYTFVVTYAVALETGFLLSYFMSGKYNRRFALQVVFSFRALIVIPFYFGISQWVEIPFFFIAGVE